MNGIDNKSHPGALPLTQQLAYALPALPLALIGIPIYVYLPKFYTDTMGMGLSTVGMLLLGVRLFDALTDPVIGYLSDTTKSRLGRRRPYIAGGSVGLAISIIFLFNPPEMNGPAMAIYFGGWLFALFFFWTLVTIPYESLGPELTSDYHQRTALFSLRDGFLILGTLLAAAAPIMIGQLFDLTGQTMTESRRFAVMSLLFTPLVLAAAGICIWKIRETASLKSSENMGWASVFKNRPFIILITGYTISALGSSLPATLILFYVEYVLGAGNAEIFLLIYFLTGILFLPLWVKISQRTGKKKAWIMSMLLNTGAFSGVFFLGAGDETAYGWLVFLSGIGFGASLALPSAIQADVIDYDHLHTGQRREGRYLGIWSVAKKLSAALGIGIGLWVLGQSGYTANTPQGEDTLFMLRVLYALVPCLCNLVAIGVICFYPITENVHARIREEIDARAC
jgi:GPH family glycoside/pentoside/hexuronide:cation symporter